MVELRKRPAPPPSAAPPPTKRRSSASSNNKNSNKSTANPQQTKLEEKSSLSTEQTEDSRPRIFGDKQCLPASTPNKELAVGDTVDFNSGIGSIEVTTHDGKNVTLKTLHGQSDGGIVIFTYPKASTPGCKLFPLKATADICDDVEVAFLIFRIRTSLLYVFMPYGLHLKKIYPPLFSLSLLHSCPPLSLATD